MRGHLHGGWLGSGCSARDPCTHRASERAQAAATPTSSAPSALCCARAPQVVDTVAVPADLGGKPQVRSRRLPPALRRTSGPLHILRGGGQRARRRPTRKRCLPPCRPAAGGLLPLLEVQDLPHVRRRARAAQQGKCARRLGRLAAPGPVEACRRRTRSCRPCRASRGSRHALVPACPGCAAGHRRQRGPPAGQVLELKEQQWHRGWHGARPARTNWPCTRRSPCHAHLFHYCR